MNSEFTNLSTIGRKAVAASAWRTVEDCASRLLDRDADDPEGYFFRGLVEKAADRPKSATAAFETVLALDARRYDAAIELAGQYSKARQNARAEELLMRYTAALENSPRYLNLAGTIYTDIGRPERAWPLFIAACKLQPEITQFRANLAACAVYVGEMQTAIDEYKELLRQYPLHQRNHYQLSRLARATDSGHIEQMKAVLCKSQLTADRNIFLHFALGKEYEDLRQWDNAFDHFKAANDAAHAVSLYNVETDIAVVDAVIDVCTKEWLHRDPPSTSADPNPLFIAGLPRTGTTLVERIVASHSEVQSVGETEFLQMHIRKVSEVPALEKMTPEIIVAAAGKSIELIRNGYMDTIHYRLQGCPLFIDKLPFNFLYLGFVAKAWPGRPILWMRRNPMDACFSMYKQLFTWAYKYSYNLDTLARYYIAYDRLGRHWRSVLGDQLIEVHYENLVTDQEVETRRLLDSLGLEFEEGCLSFQNNAAPVTTASSVQVREKIHSKSVQHWRHYERQLEGLRRQLENAGIATC